MIIYWQIRNQEFNHSGIDCYDYCADKKHFQNYKKEIKYKFNSWGCRDHEPPVNLKDLIWCVGDSFTLGLGQPFNETWPQLLQQKTHYRVLNIAQDGCPNDMISSRVCEINKEHQPKKIIVLWSFLHRRYKDGNFYHYDKNNANDDIINFVENFNKANTNNNILNYIIPNAFIDNNGRTLNVQQLQKLLDSLIKGKIKVVEQVDFSRDGIHFDILTCKNLVTDIVKNL